jgi:hypothetical protein
MKKQIAFCEELKMILLKGGKRKSAYFIFGSIAKRRMGSDTGSQWETCDRNGGGKDGCGGWYQEEDKLKQNCVHSGAPLNRSIASLGLVT